jgi:hypothetical protein
MKIINLTQHASTIDQHEAGVIDLESSRKESLVRLLTINEGTLTSPCIEEEMQSRAAGIAELIWPEIQEAIMARSEDVVFEAREGRSIAAWNLMRNTPLFHVMVGGFPFLMKFLERELSRRGVQPLYATSTRIAKEVVNPDGTVTKTSKFKHIGFLEV